MKKDEKDNRSLGEKLDDASDAVFETLEDVTMGKQKDFQHDIPATMVDGNGIRKVNKIQTRKNLNKRIFGKTGVKILAIIIVLGVIGCLIYYLLNMLLLS